MRTGINKAILDWFKDSRIGQEINKEFKTIGFLRDLKNFLNSCTDAQRLVNAEKVAFHVLKHNDLSDMVNIRQEVRKLELTRKITYPKQTDHSAHSVYVYLLGLFLIDNSEILKDTLFSTGKLYEAFNDGHWDTFLFPWAYNSLLHDIGYIFFEPPHLTNSSRKAIERLYHPRTLELLLKPSNKKLDYEFYQFMNFIREVIIDSNWPKIDYSNKIYPDDTLDVLRILPWGDRIGLHHDAFVTFQKFGSQDLEDILALENYAYSVSETGYDGKSSGIVDHGVASSLFLLQWNSYYYWLAEETKSKMPHWFDWFFLRFTQDVTIDPYQYNYDLLNLSRDIVPATCAIAFHNILPTKANRNFYLPIDLDKYPLVYLAILSDELQKWDRFPAGEENLNSLEDFEINSLTSEDIKVVPNEKKPTLIIIGHKSFYTKLIDILDQRLKNWRQVLSLENK